MPKTLPPKSSLSLSRWVSAKKKEGVAKAKVAVGGVPNLYLMFECVKLSDGKPSYRTRWEFRKKPCPAFPTGKSVALGSYEAVSLEKAREAARKAAELIAEGIDPVQEKKNQRQAALKAQLEAQKKARTFEDVASEFMKYAAQSGEFANNPHAEKHAYSRLRLHILPIIGNIPIATLNPKDVARLFNEGTLKDIGSLSNKCRALISKVCGFAVSKEYRDASLADPANLKALRYLIDPEKAVRKPSIEQAALDYSELPEFFNALLEHESLGSLPLAFLILTVGRIGQVRNWSDSKEARGARWSQIDLEARTWTIKGTEMKTGKTEGRNYVCPLSDAALEILRRAPRIEGCDYIFPGTGAQCSYRPVSDTCIRNVIRDLGIKRGSPWVDRNRLDEDGKPRKIVPHGFRATFDTWAHSPAHGNNKRFNHITIETSLDHKESTTDKKHYNRPLTDSAFFEERRKLMEDWGRYCMEGKWPDED